MVESAVEPSRRQPLAPDRRVSIVVPAYNNAIELSRCLEALSRLHVPPAEIFVVDDGSDKRLAVDESRARLLRVERNGGPAGARNRGAREASGEILLFVDSDVVLAPDATARVVDKFRQDPDLGAVFGSYDANPTAPGVVSQFRNLLHHFTHQRAQAEAATFWAGCGAVRRDAFEVVGGFDESARWNFIEDIELGYRLRRAGYRIALDKELVGTHLKEWTLKSVVVTDTLRRAAPWTRLILGSGYAPPDLNLTASQRWSVAVVVLAAALAGAAIWWPPLIALALAALCVVVVLNREFYRYLARLRGVRFVLASFPLHLLYFLCSALGFLYGWLEFHLRRVRGFDHGSSTAR